MLGPVDEVIREVERAFPDLTIIVRGNRVAIVSRSKQTEAQAAQAEDLVNTIIQAAYTAPMDADTVRRMLDQNVLKNHVRLEHPGHGPVRDKLAQSTSNERAHARSAGSHDPTYRKPTVPGVITFAAGVPVRAKTAGQVAYVNAIESHTITFGIGTPSNRTPSPSALAPQAPARRIWPWPRLCVPSRTSRFAASSSRARPWRPAKASAFCPAR